MTALLILMCVFVYATDVFLLISYEWATYAFYTAVAVAALLALAVYIVSAIKKPKSEKSAAKLCLIIKCVLIPNYLFNIIVTFALALTGTLFLGYFPISIALWFMVLAIFAFNYFIMVATGMPLICSIIKDKGRRGVIKALHVATQFFYIADIADAIFNLVTADENRMPPPPPPYYYGPWH